MHKKQYGVTIIGGSGYGAGELLRLLELHPQIEACAVTSRSHAGAPVSSIHTHLEGLSKLSFSATLPPDWHKGYAATAIICSMPAGQAAAAISDAISQGLPDTTRIIDLSGDFRLHDSAQHACYYPEVPFAPEIRSRCVYALPEIVDHKAIANARYLSNPGCLSTAAIMALAPVRDLTCIGSVVVDAKTGTSGAGREPQPSMHHPSRAHDFTAYKVLDHRHEPEILQALGPRFTANNSLMFVPHLLPVSRGILASCYLTLSDPKVAAEVPARYKELYSNSPFVRLRSRPPRLVDVVGTNFCDIQIVVRNTQVVVLVATDNLGKGMAGQCIQNLNIAWGLPQETGLMNASLGPV